MDAERWAALQANFDELVDMEPEARQQRLVIMAATDPELSEQLARLLAADASAERLLRPLEAPRFPPLAAAGRAASVSTGSAGSIASDAAEAAAAAGVGTASGSGGREGDPFGLSGRTVSHFRVQQVLGAGGMGVVYRAEDLRLGRTVALKFLLPQYSLDTAAKERFLLEARVASALDHAHICTIHEAGESEQGQLFLAMSCYQGETLRERLAREAVLPVAEAMELVRQLSSALGAAHGVGVVHRDLKPGNLMLSAEGGLKILDFGLAKVRDLSLTGSGLRPGTVAYMSPEQLSGTAEVGERSDLWSLGVVLYEMLTGKQPFGSGHELSTVYRILYEEPEAPSTLRPEITAELEAIVLRLLSKEPEARYASAAEVLEALGQMERPLAPRASDPCPVGQPRESRDRRLHQLPVQPTAFIGRQKEVGEIEERLQRAEVRLLTLTGPGGVGKTRLALQAAAELAASLPNGVVFVNLAPLTDPRLIPSAIAQALGVREAAQRPLVETIQEHLRERRSLLLLDNFEHLVEGAAVVSHLLAAAPEVKVLVTSRVALHLQGEHEYAVPPLSLPEKQRLSSVEQLMGCEAVRLFVERARQVRPDFSVTGDNAEQVAEICHRLDGLPLAIELAAARIKVLPPRAILARLESRLQLLTGGARDLPARQRTLRDAIAWSYELLSEAQKVLFRRLSVFAGGCTLEAIEAICQDREHEVLEGVASLVEKSLLRAEECEGGAELRFGMLETIDEYAAEKLAQSAEADDLRRRHAAFFLVLAEEAHPQLSGSEQGQWLVRLEREHGNFRVALRSALDLDEIEIAARLAGALPTFWIRHGHLREGGQWLEEVLSCGDACSPGARAWVHLGTGNLAFRRGDLRSAQIHYETSLQLSRRSHDMPVAARALLNLGGVAGEQGDEARAERFFEESATLLRDLGEKFLTGQVLINLGVIAERQGDTARAIARFEESLVLLREVGDSSNAGLALSNLGDIAFDQGDYVRAETLFRQSLLLARDADNTYQMVCELADLAVVAVAIEQPERAARLFAAAEAYFAAIGARPWKDKTKHEQGHAAAYAQLDEAACQRAWKEGNEMTLEEAVACALVA